MSQFLAKAKYQVENQVRQFVAGEEGATMVEYGLMVALIAVVCITAVTLLGGNISDIFDDVATKVAPTAT